MTRLNRYLLGQNLYYLLLCLGTGIGIYLLVDVFDRLDEFIEAEVGVRTILVYFLAKVPLIVSQVLPAVFLLALIVQLSIMARQLEITALEASGISLLPLALFFVLYAFICSGVQLGLSEGLGVLGQKESRAIWEHEVKGADLGQKVLHDIWFKDQDLVINLDRVRPQAKTGQGITVYVLDQSFERIERIYQGQGFVQRDAGWELQAVTTFWPQGFNSAQLDRITLPIDQDMQDFLAVGSKTMPESLSILELGRLIKELHKSGSNVERLATAWHMKLAYGLSLVVMSLLALCIIHSSWNVYVNIPIGLVLVLVYYGMFMIGGTLGEKGIVSPWVGGWLGDLVWGGIAGLRLAWIISPRRIKSRLNRLALAPKRRQSVV